MAAGIIITRRNKGLRLRDGMPPHPFGNNVGYRFEILKSSLMKYTRTSSINF
ncbi:hypothetical protein BH20BAC1_BH20BAC1_02960 [soil metagenome]